MSSRVGSLVCTLPHLRVIFTHLNFSIFNITRDYYTPSCDQRLKELIYRLYVRVINGDCCYIFEFYFSFVSCLYYQKKNTTSVSLRVLTLSNSMFEK